MQFIIFGYFRRLPLYPYTRDIFKEFIYVFGFISIGETNHFIQINLLMIIYNLDRFASIISLYKQL